MLISRHRAGRQQRRRHQAAAHMPLNLLIHSRAGAKVGTIERLRVVGAELGEKK